MKKVSIIIVTYKSEKDIFDCIGSIYKTLDIDSREIEIIVVDNNSPGQADMFRRIRELFGDNILLIANEKNGGYGQGNNLGIKSATAPIILIMNPDVRLFQPTLKQSLSVFEQDPDLVMLGMKQMYSVDKTTTKSFAISKNIGLFQTIRCLICKRFDIYIPKYMYIGGACFFIRKNSFEKIGMFDENIFMYGEENDIHYRIINKFGTKIRYVKTLRYIHLTEARSLTMDYMKKTLASNIYVMGKMNIPQDAVIKYYYKNTNQLIFKQKLLSLIGKQDKELLLLLMAFRLYLKDLL